MFSFIAIRQYAVSQLRTSTNIVEAIVTGDYSLRANIRGKKGVLAEFNALLNGLTERLSKQSLITREQQILLTKIINQIDVAIIACDEQHRISLMNPAAEKLFSSKQHDIIGWPIKQLGLHPVIEKDFQASIQITLPNKKESVLVSKDSYLENGKQNTLIFITHIQHILREEERKAWQKLLRVLSHEINNSLAPIASIAETLASLEAKKKVIRAEYKDDFVQGLNVVQERAHALNHFIQNYHRLAKLPEPNKSEIALHELINDTCLLFADVTFKVQDGKALVLADSEQIQQVLVNLIKNAHEANVSKLQGIEAPSLVTITWTQIDEILEISIIDNGYGVKNPENLFTPYYSTKKTGSGIGLSLSRQIIRNHGEELTLTNNLELGATAKFTLQAITGK
ncbi:sensor histidine kinase [Ningiella sp. W23]|uniref:sensor histidine kinase n=1 Tax=Ningiella sp. W23 TaxID=3023715 RepID=UPI0037572B8E